jgi:serine protease Do
MKNWTRSLLVLAVIGSGAAIGGGLTQAWISNANFARAQQVVSEAKQNLATVQDLSNVFKTVSKAVEPSVVSIQTRSAVPTSGMPQFFGIPDGQGPMAMGTGSGVILEVTGDGAFVLTNNHVVANANSLEVTLYDGRVISDAKVIGTDPRTDLAVVKIRADKLIAASWGDSRSLEKGDWVLAFGSPFGYVGSMTAGIVSALNRQVGILGEFGYEEFIQVDAAINPGNSGGPLVNTRGEVIGINTAIASRTGAFNGLGFAVPSRLARPVFESLKSDGRVQRGYLGVGIADVRSNDDVTRQRVEATGFKGESGVFVDRVGSDTPAAGILEPGDIVTQIDGKPVATMNELRERIALTKPGTEVKFKVFREGKDIEVAIKVGEQPDESAVARATGGPRGEPRRPSEFVQGLTMQSLSPDLVERLGVSGVDEGAAITQVAPGSAAFQAGLRPGDVITRVNGRPVSSAADAAEAIRSAETARAIRLNVTNREGSRFVMITQR